MKWLLLILSLPTENASARMRAWRALKACGAAVLRDGVSVLPDGVERQATLARISEEVNTAGGQAWLLETRAEETAFASLFDRTGEYRQVAADLEDTHAALNTTAAPDLARLAKKLRKQVTALGEIDFFPGEARRQVLARLDELDRRIRALQSPDEPSPRQSTLVRLDLDDYRGRLWATRARPWVDRLASAWLIRRFIDPEARFLWLDAPADCPAEALGFDFDGAEFTHVGDFVSFETLLHSFGLESDAALGRLARVVHFLDVGGLPVAEAPGLESLLAGMRASLADDDELLAAAGQTFDFLYANYLDTAR